VKARLFILRNQIIELPCEIPDNTGSVKRGKDLLTVDVDHKRKLPWYEGEAMFVLVGNVEVVAQLRLYQDLRESDSPTGKAYSYRLVGQKVKVAENPRLSLHFDQNTGETSMYAPEDDNGPELSEIVAALLAATPAERGKVLEPGEDILPEGMVGDTTDVAFYRKLDKFIEILKAEEKTNSMAKGLVQLCYALKNHIAAEVLAKTILSGKLDQQIRVMTQLQDKYDKLEADVKELVENYIPDLSAELSDDET